MTRRSLATWALGALLLAGCTSETTPVEEEPAQIRTWIDGEVTAKGGTLVVQSLYDPAGTLDLPQPQVQGLTFEQGDVRVEQVGDHEVVTQRFAFTGQKGSYEITALTADWRGPEGEAFTAVATPVFVDLGVEPPDVGEPEDIVEPAPVRTIPWAVLGGGALAVALFGGGLAVAFGPTRKRALPEVPPEAPDVVAIRAWEAIRASTELDDYAKAQHLSKIWREYTEAVLGFPASAWTTTEILGHLRGLAHLPEGNVPRAKRLLRATDRVKFAEHDPERDFFDDLDADLRGFVDSTRPRNWTEGAE